MATFDKINQDTDKLFPTEIIGLQAVAKNKHLTKKVWIHLDYFYWDTECCDLVTFDKLIWVTDLTS